jgi:hypothetical protein
MPQVQILGGPLIILIPASHEKARYRGTWIVAAERIRLSSGRRLSLKRPAPEG